MPEISIIIPVYNGEKYIARCIDSIFAQTFSDFELLVINDGSTDNTLEVLRKYNDRRLKVVNKINGGVSSARNKGIELAEGRYIMFCDSDDFVHPQWCECMLLNIKKHPDSYVNCLFDKVYQDSVSDELFNSDEMVAESTDYFEVYKKGMSGRVYNTIYKTDLLRNNSILSDLNIPIGEDVIFNSKYMEFCNNTVLVNKVLYHYFRHAESATSKYNSNRLKYDIDTFYCRIPYIEEIHIPEYCDMWLYMLLNLFDNIHDKRNKMSWIKRMNYNQRIFRSKEFAYCLKNASGKNEGKKLMKLLKTKNYYLYWIITKLKK